MHWLASVGTINLIDVLTYYLILTFVVGTTVRLRNYLAIGGFIYRFPDRWPKLLGLVKHHKAIFLRWPTLLPIGLTLVLTLVNALASRLVWSHAKVSSAEHWLQTWEAPAVRILTFGFINPPAGRGAVRQRKETAARGVGNPPPGTSPRP